MSTTTTNTIPAANHLSEAPDPQDPADTVKVWGYCTDFCIESGPANGMSVEEHGKVCESRSLSVSQVTSDDGRGFGISSRVVRPYYHGEVHRSLVYGDARDSRVELELSADDAPWGSEPERLRLSPSAARSLARHLLHLADTAEGVQSFLGTKERRA
ncbi:hypothetical protein [Phycicoccus sp. 3266]|uniref:hypothetical protein n=1 Tax=Phycicoccus sp. 3266 TaxID=2817751 RepID=UPI00286464FA|nr:hypothetical protein [Phycicoccus sp. 3266]MDR6862168.1 hypothetical protein [Phycicoccus sp. 3266]